MFVNHAHGLFWNTLLVKLPSNSLLIVWWLGNRTSLPWCQKICQNGCFTFPKWWIFQSFLKVGAKSIVKYHYSPHLGGGFKHFFMFTPIWGRFPFWLIFLRWVETTNQITIHLMVLNFSLIQFHFAHPSCSGFLFQRGLFVNGAQLTLRPRRLQLGS